MKKTILYLFALVTFFACQTNSQTEEKSTAVGHEGWLEGTSEEKFEEVAHQLGGFSRTMVEVSYRYSELYWSGMDENWGYAEHQVEHIIEAMEDGLKRRPERAESAESFMKESIPAIEALIKKEDKEEFLKGFRALTSGCNACHAKEGESYIMIAEPEIRTSPVRF
ncbi:hypothetical protein Belba_3496 [Belliella baltica DSM 15883]|uniref:Cytochrome c domain-containing protein n=1 Tax=Belliella baltica (strain DSM 15883 / CIP 108006 / LMG 21964 / BA134) TaxID=866536 RepID=I3Z9S9_BELBD|nr:hypothetical protein [Belliella baltica]AFL85997.1 hypothetical protein Belba_3496 [Belliella baltica DSM 15883]